MYIIDLRYHIIIGLFLLIFHFQEPDYANAGDWTSLDSVPAQPAEGAVSLQRSSDGWEKYLDGCTNKPYYYHPAKQASQWDVPTTWKPLPVSNTLLSSSRDF